MLFFSDMIFSTGSKTFLVGEYAILFGGSAILLASKPDFKLKILRDKSGLTGINILSPAGIFYQKHIKVFEGFKLVFEDPHNGMGGFGASSAQFSLLYKAFLRLTGKDFSLEKFLSEYKKIASTGTIAPSGADCVAQILNKNIWFDGKKTIRELEIDFKNVGIAVFKTKFKIATHNHLRELKPIKDIQLLEEKVILVKNGILTKSELLFSKGINEFFALMQNLNLVLPEISEIICDLMQCESILAAKGCGAMGADTILIAYNKSMKAQMIKATKNIKLYPIIL